MRFDPTTATAATVGQYLELWTPDVLTEAEVDRWIGVAKQYNLRTYLVFEQWLPQVVAGLQGTDIRIGTGITFPMGAEAPAVKAKAVEHALDLGVTTIDFSMNWRALMAGRVAQVKEELRLFSEIAAAVERKTIIEVCFLDDERIKQASELVAEAGIHWVKTSTGQFQGPTMQQVKLILDTLAGTQTRCKVSGVKVPRPQNAYAFLMAGVEIIGSQGVVEIIEGLDMLRGVGVLPAYRG
jgi:deoxyribose-phosphate aldolase